MPVDHDTAPDTRADTRRVDVAIIGAGLAGTSAANALGRAGYRVALIDPHRVHPHDFRAEKLGERQMDILKRLKLDAAIRAAVTPFDGVWIARFGRVVERKVEREYGADYAAMVNALRSILPSTVDFIEGRVAEAVTGPDLQTLTLGDGGRVEARLVVVATGLGEALRRKLGIERVEESPAHSLSFGFNLSRLPSAFPFASLVYCGEQFGDLVSYLTLFPIGTTMRANLFVHRSMTEEWTKAFRARPVETLTRLMPGIERLCGPLEIDGPVEARPITLTTTRGHRQDGFVLIGDAYSVSCPITGTGIHKVLTDVEQLCTAHVPRWMETPGMTAEKLASFYADPAKVASDTFALKKSRFSRAMVVERGLPWRLRRVRNNAIRRVYYLAKTMFGHIPVPRRAGQP